LYRDWFRFGAISVVRFDELTFYDPIDPFILSSLSWTGSDHPIASFETP
jgi:hypothetical protein